MESFTCKQCSTPLASDLWYCDSCRAKQMRANLMDLSWMQQCGVYAGDRPGETLADTFRRQIQEIEGREG